MSSSLTAFESGMLGRPMLAERPVSAVTIATLMAAKQAEHPQTDNQSAVEGDSEDVLTYAQYTVRLKNGQKFMIRVDELDAWR